MTLTFDLSPLKSNQFILESQLTFGQSLRKIPQSFLEIFHSQESQPDGWTTSGTDCRLCKDIKVAEAVGRLKVEQRGVVRTLVTN